LPSIRREDDVRVDIPASRPGVLSSRDVTILPTADTVSHVVQVRIGLPASNVSIKPGMFARASFQTTANDEASKLLIPLSAVIRRSELNAVYVVDKAGRPGLRQVRLGRQQGSRIEALSGVETGELVALDPIAAVKALQP